MQMSHVPWPERGNGVVPMRLGVRSPFNPKNESLPFLSTAAMLRLVRSIIRMDDDDLDPSEGESPIRLNSSNGS